MSVGNIRPINNKAEEAIESIAQTKAEAAKGDQEAVRKLARAQAANHTPPAQQPVGTTQKRFDVKA